MHIERLQDEILHEFVVGHEQVESILDPLKALRTRLKLTLGGRLPNDFGDRPQLDYA